MLRVRIACCFALVLLTFIATACTSAPPALENAPTAKGLGTTTSTASTSVRLLAEARQYAFRVRNANCLATGSSFATANGIVTNRHVASGATSLELATWTGTDFAASVRSISETPGPDLALLSGGSAKSLAALATSDAPDGTQVWAAGYPEGTQLSVLPGIVTDYVPGSDYTAPGQIMEITNPIKPGNSGSPLLDSAGKVVGVVFALNSVTGNGLAIPVSTLEQFLTAPGADTTGTCIG